MENAWTLVTYQLGAQEKDGSFECIPIKSEKFYPGLPVYWCGDWRWCPPKECLPYLDDGWKAMFAAHPDGGGEKYQEIVRKEPVNV